MNITYVDRAQSDLDYVKYLSDQGNKEDATKLQKEYLKYMLYLITKEDVYKKKHMVAITQIAIELIDLEI